MYLKFKGRKYYRGYVISHYYAKNLLNFQKKFRIKIPEPLWNIQHIIRVITTAFEVNLISRNFGAMNFIKLLIKKLLL
jgi:hypothetical protein